MKHSFISNLLFLVAINILPSCSDSKTPKALNGYWYSGDTSELMSIEGKNGLVLYAKFNSSNTPDYEAAMSRFININEDDESVCSFAVANETLTFSNLNKPHKDISDDAWNILLKYLNLQPETQTAEEIQGKLKLLKQELKGKIKYIGSYGDAFGETETILFFIEGGKEKTGILGVRCDLMGEDCSPTEFKIISKPEEATREHNVSSSDKESVSGPYVAQDKKDKIERALVNAFNKAPQYPLTFKTGFSSAHYDRAPIYFSMTPVDDKGSIDDGYFIFWYTDKYNSLYVRYYGNYERTDNYIRLYNVYERNNTKPGGRGDRLYDRKYQILSNGNDITLSGKRITKMTEQMNMSLSPNTSQLSRSRVLSGVNY